MAALTDPGRQRQVNEDQAVALELPGGTLLLAVADGVGGMGQGDVASRETVTSLQRLLAEDPAADHVAALARAAAAINRQVWQMGSAGAGEGTMASTLVAALISGGRLSWVNIGDSRLYLLNNGKLEQLTHDHSYVAEQLSAGAITEEEAATSKFRHVITRAVGAEETVEPELGGPLDLPSPCTILLCTDGLYRVVEDGQLAAELAAENAPSICQRLIGLANEGGGPDNIGVAVLKHESGGS